MLHIKNATAVDIPLIRELCQQAWPQTYTPILGPQQVAYMLGLFYSPESLEKQMGESGHSFIICYCDDEPAAFAAYSEVEPHIFKLHKLYILPEQQGRGIGKFMVSYIVHDIIKTNGAESLLLNVNRYNYPAIAFYEKTGFKKLSEEDIDIGNGYFMNDYVLGMDV